MAGIDATRGTRGAAWKRRLRAPVLGAAWLAIPTVPLSFSALVGIGDRIVSGEKHQTPFHGL